MCVYLLWIFSDFRKSLRLFEKLSICEKSIRRNGVRKCIRSGKWRSGYYYLGFFHLRKRPLREYSFGKVVGNLYHERVFFFVFFLKNWSVLNSRRLNEGLRIAIVRIYKRDKFLNRMLITNCTTPVDSTFLSEVW